MPDRPLHRRIFAHFRGQAVGYIALFFALGGGYAIAATNSKTIHGCVVKKSGELLVKSRCAARAAAPGLEPARTRWPFGRYRLGLSERPRLHGRRVTRGLKVNTYQPASTTSKPTPAECAKVTSAPQVTVNAAISSASRRTRQAWETLQAASEEVHRQTGVVIRRLFTRTDEAFNVSRALLLSE